MNHVRRLASRPIGVALLVPAALAAGAVARSRPGVPTLLVAAALVALGALWTLGTIGRLRAAEALALRDPLTTLPNRALLEDRIEQALARSRRTGEPFALVVLDLNGFKEVNDIRGHRAGDEVLQRLAERLESVVRESDTVARVGGDEFVVLSLGTRDEDEAALLVGRLRAALRSPLAVEGVTVELDASIGYALHPDDGATPEELLACADGQMYATKRDADATPLRGSLDAGSSASSRRRSSGTSSSSTTSRFCVSTTDRWSEPRRWCDVSTRTAVSSPPPSSSRTSNGRR